MTNELIARELMRVATLLIGSSWVIPQSNVSDKEVRQRLEYELGIIHNMGFDTYFLIVWDLCRYARGRGIWYNARGSAAGSIVAYALEITLVDPLEQLLMLLLI